MSALLSASTKRANPANLAYDSSRNQNHLIQVDTHDANTLPNHTSNLNRCTDERFSRSAHCNSDPEIYSDLDHIRHRLPLTGAHASTQTRVK